MSGRSSQLGLSYADLTDQRTIAANRRGQVTPQQERLIRQMVGVDRGSALTGAAGAAGFLVFAGSVFVNAWQGLGPFPARLTAWLPLVIFAAIAVAAEVVLIRWALRAWRIVDLTTRDLERSRVAHAEGLVVWGTGRYGIKSYVMRVGGRALRAPAHPLQLPLGGYRCAFLAQSGWLLSAEALPGDDRRPRGAPHSDDQPHEQAIIARQHGFTHGDLLANRAGRLSARQRSAVAGAALLWGLGAAGAGAIGLLPQLAPVVRVLFALGAVFLIYQVYRNLRDAASSAVASAEGQLTVRYQTSQRSLNIFYRVGGQEFELSNRMISRQAYSTLIEGQRYRVYALRNTRIVLSLERLV